MIVWPTLTCPSPAITTWPLWRTHRIVVWRKISASCSRMGTLINLFQMIHADMSIALRGRQTRMPEHLLDRSQVGTITQHMRSKAVAQPVRRQARCEAAIDNSLLQNFL